LYRDNFKASVESLQEQIKAIQSWGSELEVKNTMLHDMKDEISKVAREMQSRNGALQLERDLLKKRVIEMDNEIQTLRSHLGVSDHPKNTEVRTVESEIHEITQELDYIESQKEEWDKTFDGLKTELEVKNARISELEAMIQNQNK
jgi:chromosome segregation ATPase